MSASAGKLHSIALSSNGSVFTWGDGRHGQLGLPVVADFINVNGELPVCMYLPYRVPFLEPGRLKPNDRCLNPEHAFVSSSCCTLSLEDASGSQPLGCSYLDGKVQLTFGMNPRATAVAAGFYHSMVMSVCGTIWAFGLNRHGALGLGNTARRLLPAQAGLAAICVLFAYKSATKNGITGLSLLKQLCLLKS